MNAVGVADTVSTLGFGLALIFLVRTPRRVLDPPTKLFFGVALAVYFLVGVSNVLQHAGASSSLDRYEDYTEDLFLPFFLFGLYSVSTKRELDRRARAEEGLRENRQRYRTLVENVDLGITLIDADFTVVMANAAASRLFGVRPSELVGQECFRAFRRRDASCSDCPGRVAMTTGRPAQLDVEPPASDDGHRLLRIHAFPLPAREGRAQGFIEVVADRTEQARAEQLRRQMDLQVLQSQKFESLSALTGGIAHDFNNLLMGVLGNAEMALLKLAPASPAGVYLKRIEAAALKASDLTRQMTAYSGSAKPKAEPVDLSELVETAAPLVEAASAREATVRYRLAEHLPKLLGDADQLRQVMMTLVTNASEALGGRPGTITLSTDTVKAERGLRIETVTGADLPDGTYAVLEVADTGSGIDAEAIPRLFDPFYSTKFTGRGLGLPAAMGIAKAHGGAIRVESEVGLGTRFRVLLPVPSGSAAAAPGHRERAARGLARRIILVVDDEQTVRAVTRMALGELGFEVLTTGDPREFLRLLGQCGAHVAALVLDAALPELDGETALEEIRRIDADVPVILASGHGEHAAAVELAGRARTGVLHKPYDRGDLVAAVATALAQTRETADAAQCPGD